MPPQMIFFLVYRYIKHLKTSRLKEYMLNCSGASISAIFISKNNIMHYNPANSFPLVNLLRVGDGTVLLVSRLEKSLYPLVMQKECALATMLRSPLLITGTGHKPCNMDWICIQLVCFFLKSPNYRATYEVVVCMFPGLSRPL